MTAPPRMSPPTSFGFSASTSGAVIETATRMRSRTPGAKRSSWASIDIRPIDGRTGRHVRVRPEHVPPRRRPARVDDRGLHDEHVRAIRMSAAQHLATPPRRSRLGCRRGARSARWRPADPSTARPGEREVELGDARTAAEAGEPTAVTGWQGFTGVAREELGRGVEQRDPARFEVGPRVHLEPGVDASAERQELLGQRVGDRLRAADRHAPSARVRVRAQQQAGSRGRERRMPPRRVRGDPGEQGVGGEIAEAPSVRDGPLLEHPPGVAEGVDRMRWHAQQLGLGERGDASQVLDERAEQPAPVASRRCRVRVPCGRGRDTRSRPRDRRSDARTTLPG